MATLARSALAAIAAILLLAGCGEAKKPAPGASLRLRPVRMADLPGWGADKPSEAMPALALSCGRFAKLAPERPVGPGALAGTIGDWRPICAAAAAVPAGDDAAARAFLEAWFEPFLAESSAGDDDSLFTGYFEMELRGSRTPDDTYRAPLYRVPDDLITVDLGDFQADLKGRRVTGRVEKNKLKPYYSRAEIAAGALAGRGLELLWTDDAIDAFFLEVQGSGRVQLPDGSKVRIGFAGQNGLPYYAIARTLLQNGTFKKGEASMQRLRAWLRDHPAEAQDLMNKNRSYVFFREIEGDGPIGAQGVPLTAGRSIAIDPGFLALGLPVWLDTTWPKGTPQDGQPLQRLMMAQDTGGAIKGPVRADLFWGTGDAALAIAGTMQQAGRYFLLLPKLAAEQRRAIIAQAMLP